MTSRSGQTVITQPDNDDQSGNLDHILNATAYYEKLDALELVTAEICGIRWGLHGINWPSYQVSHAIVSLRSSLSALENLQLEGFCGDSLSILVEDQSRPGVVNAIHISSREIASILARLTLDSSSHFTYNTPKDVLEKLGVPLDRYYRPVDFSDLVSKVLSLGLVSFSGSHVCRFDLNMWGISVENIPLFEDYSFGLRQLACLKNFVGGPAWVLGKNKPEQGQERLKVSLLVRDLQELWGPIWLLETANEGSIIRTENGFVVPLSREEQLDSSLDEIECHWCSDITNYVTQVNPIRLTGTSRVLIGTEPANQARLASNPSCKSQICQIEEHIHKQLQFAGTQNEYYTRDGHDFQLSGGQYLNIGAIIKYKRNPMRTMKISIIDACSAPGTDIEALLKLKIGLEISACTGNARRVTLWDALRLSKAAPLCKHKMADPDCFKSCWNHRNSGSLNFEAQVSPTALTPEQIHLTIVNSIRGLQHTGVDPEGSLQACWPFVDGNWNHRIAATPHNKWFDVIADSRDTATFAVVSQDCLVSGEVCSQSFLDEEQRTCLSTLVLPRSIMKSDRASRRRHYDFLGESPGCELGNMPPETAFRVGKRSLTVKKPWQGRGRAMVATTSAGFGFGFPEFREQINPDIKGGEPIELIVCSKSFVI